MMYSIPQKVYRNLLAMSSSKNVDYAIRLDGNITMLIEKAVTLK